MNDFFLKFTLFLLMILLELSFHTLFSIALELPARPDFLLLLTLYLGFQYGPMSGMITGFFGGAIQDVTTHILGANMLILVLIGYAMGQLRRKFYIDNPLTVFTITAISVVLKIVTFILIFALILFPERNELSTWSFNEPLIYGGIFTILISPLFFLLLRKLNKQLHRPR